MKVYLAGPMTGIEQHNYPLFFRAAGVLTYLGYDVENPADNDGPDLETALANADGTSLAWADYLRRDVVRVLRSEAVVVLPGWRNSRGANLEVHIARALGMPVYRYTDNGPRPLYNLIGLSGYARTGKDTAAGFLALKGYQPLAFGDTLRSALWALNPTVAYKGDPFPIASLVQWHGYERVKENAPQCRELLQRLGTEVGRNMLGENIWVDAALAKLEDGGSYVFTDVRFPNEARAIDRLGGKVWRINRRDVGPANDHPSEVALDEWDFDAVINNWGTPDDLQRSVHRCLQ